MSHLTSFITSPAGFRQRPCPVCDNGAYQKLLAISGMPLLECSFSHSRDEALAAETGDIDLVSCLNCGHVYNRAFAPERIRYSADYENALNFSARHRDYLDRTVEELIDRYALVNKKIIEIGCGAADFLRRLCERGANHGIGYDPSQPAQPPTRLGSGTLEIVGKTFDGAAPDHFDAVCCQHVLEHLPDPVATLRAARTLLVRGGIGYFEVPNGDLIIDHVNVWDLTYEHYSYFSPATLRRALNEGGFSVRRLTPAFSDQYLVAEVVKEDIVEASVSGAIDYAEHHEAFSRSAARLIAGWRNFLTRQFRQSRKVVVWGAGAKAVTFLNMLELNAGRGIDFVVDINPRKAGRFMPCTAQEIVEPDFLRSYQPNVIIVMNPEYSREIDLQLRAMRLRPRIVAATPDGHATAATAASAHR